MARVYFCEKCGKQTEKLFNPHIGDCGYYTEPPCYGEHLYYDWDGRTGGVKICERCYKTLSKMYIVSFSNIVKKAVVRTDNCSNIEVCDRCNAPFNRVGYGGGIGIIDWEFAGADLLCNDCFARGQAVMRIFMPVKETKSILQKWLKLPEKWRLP